MEPNLKKHLYIFFTLSFMIAILSLIFFVNKKTNQDDLLDEYQILDVATNLQSASQPMDDYQFILKEFNGKLAVFKKDKREPEMVFNVLIDTLPQLDIEDLKIGLKIKNISELNERIEDFIS